MRVIFDLGHPAHFHLFKHAITVLRDSGHDVEIIARQKDCLVDLLEKTKYLLDTGGQQARLQFLIDCFLRTNEDSPIF